MGRSPILIDRESLHEREKACKSIEVLLLEESGDLRSTYNQFCEYLAEQGIVSRKCRSYHL
jgi:hypothetical protein